MTRSQLTHMPEYFDRYINMTDDVDIPVALQTSLDELENAPIAMWKSLGEKVYAPGKWTIKDILQHMIDVERVFSYRATAFARGENNAPSFDEELYAKNTAVAERTIEDLLEEAICLRRSFIYLYRSFTPEMLERMGTGFKGKYSVGSIGFIVPGHQRWHFRILEEKYYPLCESAKTIDMHS